jgi:hypothetical protein
MYKEILSKLMILFYFKTMTKKYYEFMLINNKNKDKTNKNRYLIKNNEYYLFIKDIDKIKIF